MMYRVAGVAQKHVFAAILHRPLTLLNIIERAQHKQGELFSKDAGNSKRNFAQSRNSLT
jgi:hypothetical protein